MFGKYPVPGRVAPETVEARNQRRLWAAIDAAIRAWENSETNGYGPMDDAMFDLREVRDELKPRWINDG